MPMASWRRLRRGLIDSVPRQTRHAGQWLSWTSANGAPAGDLDTATTSCLASMMLSSRSRIAGARTSAAPIVRRSWGNAGAVLPMYCAEDSPAGCVELPFPVTEMTLTDRFNRAMTYATLVHAGQLRKGTSVPYISHLLLVAGLVLEHGGTEDEAIAALLHDAVEDAGVTPAQLEAQFGPMVAAGVEALTKRQSVPKA